MSQVPKNDLLAPINCPPGLEYLAKTDQILVHQEVDLLEVVSGYKTQNRFAIKNAAGQKIYNAVEDSKLIAMNLCGKSRPFHMDIADNSSKNVIHLYKRRACNLGLASCCLLCCSPCCLQRMDVYTPPGTIVGTVAQKWSKSSPSFVIRNTNGDTVFLIRGPIRTTSLPGSSVEFEILSANDHNKVGIISKDWSGLLRELFTNADFFGVKFPMNLDVRMKAVLLGACILIDAIYYETSKKK